MVKHSKGMRRLGEHPSGKKCTRARNWSGATVMSKLCEHCHEQRCKAHCKCKRNGIAGARGRKGAGGIDKKGGAENRNGQGLVTDAVLAPNGRPAAASTELLQAEDWYKRCCSDVRTATEVELAICMYDSLQVHEELVKKLKSRGQFKLNFHGH